MADRTELQTALAQVVQGVPKRLILSKSSKGNPYRKAEILQKKAGYQIACYTEKQVFHENIAAEELLTKLTEQMEQFGQLNAWNDGFEFMVMVSAKGKVHYKKKQLQISGKNGQTAVGAQADSHNRKNGIC